MLVRHELIPECLNGQVGLALGTIVDGLHRLSPHLQ